MDSPTGLTPADCTSAIIFFLTFNPLCIGLVVAFAYTYVEGLKSAAFGLGSFFQEDTQRNRDAKRELGRYCVVTDRLIFHAGLFWLVSMGIGIVWFAGKARVWSPELGSKVGCLALLIITFIAHICILWKSVKAASSGSKTWPDCCVGKAAGLLLLGLPFLGNLIVLGLSLLPKVLCTQGLLVLLLFISLAYLSCWFLGAVLYMPSRALQFLRHEYLAQEGGQEEEP